jgi:hypothetical protein
MMLVSHEVTKIVNEKSEGRTTQKRSCNITSRLKNLSFRNSYNSYKPDIAVFRDWPQTSLRLKQKIINGVAEP